MSISRNFHQIAIFFRETNFAKVFCPKSEILYYILDDEEPRVENKRASKLLDESKVVLDFAAVSSRSHLGKFISYDDDGFNY